MTKFLGIILASIFSVILIVQVVAVHAQTADAPITGPLTSPLTSPIQQITSIITPTPTLINTLTSTPIVTQTLTPTLTPTSIPTATPTPLPLGSTSLGGLNLEGYCSSVGKSWDVVYGSTWYCDNGASSIDMTQACQWQYHQNSAFANQNILNNVFSWMCYIPQSNITPLPTVSPTETPTVISTNTLIPTPAKIIITVTPVVTATPTPSTNIAPTTILLAVKTYQQKEIFPIPFSHFFKRFPFVINAANFFNRFHTEKQSMKKACSIHDHK